MSHSGYNYDNGNDNDSDNNNDNDNDSDKYFFSHNDTVICNVEIFYKTFFIESQQKLNPQKIHILLYTKRSNTNVMFFFSIINTGFV